MRAAVYVLVLVLVACCPRTAGHIHSHKVARIERDKLSLDTCLLALVSSLLVAASGVFPLLVNRWVRLDENHKDALPLRAVLSFAVGGLLGDVFLHLLPEAWGPATGRQGDWRTGAWVLVGLLAFLMVEKLANCTDKEDRAFGGRKQTDSSPSATVLSTDSRSTRAAKDGLVRRNGHVHVVPAASEVTTAEGGERDVRGYLNLVANCTDNFTHGLAIAASYVAGPEVGVLTTLAILCHEIPHEVGDFAILLSSGFNTRSAAKAQALTATGCLVGVVAGLTAEHLSSASWWLLPFTAGGFLYIALVSIVPQLLQDSSLRDSLVQLATLLLGIVIMAMVTIVEKKSCDHMPSQLVSTTS